MPVALFGDGHNFSFDHQIFIDEEPRFYEFKNEAVCLTAAQDYS